MVPTADAIAWELFIGMLTLVIIGPGANAWFKASRPQYGLRSKPGDEIERAIAKQAVAILNRYHRHDVDAGPDLIKRVWCDAARQLGHDPEALLESF